MDFLCVYVNFTHRNQDWDYNDSAAVCIFLKELSPEMLKTTKINSKVPKKPHSLLLNQLLWTYITFKHGDEM